MGKPGVLWLSSLLVGGGGGFDEGPGCRAGAGPRFRYS